MPHRVIFSPETNAQLIELLRYISERAGEDIASGFVGAIVEFCEGLALAPWRGTQRDDVRLGLRVIGFRRRVAVAFIVEPEAVRILGVFYGGQDWEKSLREDQD